MKVRCERDGTTFEAVIVPYPSEGKKSTLYTESGDEYIECPTCGRRYFKDDEHGGKFHSDRLLTIVEPREYHTYKGWVRALKQQYKDVRIEGDKDIACAFSGKKGIGEWDGAIGYVN